MKTLVLIFAILLSATPARAEPVSTAIALIAGGVSSALAAGGWAAFALKTVASLALSKLAQALQSKPKQAGIKTTFTTAGGVNPQTLIMGWYATAGNFLAPPMSQGNAGDNGLAFLTYVLDLADHPITSLDYLIVDGNEVQFSGTPHADFGTPAVDEYAGYLWAKFYDGTQTAADPFLLSKFGAADERPWSADMIGTGIPYVIITFKLNTALYSGKPTVRAVVNGMPLYDPRKDSSSGGSGVHRHDDQSTWGFTTNPMIMAYNILRGIELGDGSIYGLSVPKEDLNLSNWSSVMNACGAALTEGGETVSTYRAGLEISVDEEPLDVIEELAKSCSGSISEAGGAWTAQIGAVEASLLSITDEDILRNHPQELDPYPALGSTYNGIVAAFPSPKALWEPRDAPNRFNATWEAEDGDRRLISSLTLNAVPYPLQVQRIMESSIKDERRFRRHSITLSPEALFLPTMGAIDWTSERNSYTTKLFEIGSKKFDPKSLAVTLEIRERDPSDWDVVEADYLEFDEPSVLPEPLADLILNNFQVAPATIVQGFLNSPKGAIRMTWDSTDTAVTGFNYLIRKVSDNEVVKQGPCSDISEEYLVVHEGLSPNVPYEVRAEPSNTNRPTAPSAWLPVTVPDLRLAAQDFDPELQASIDDAQDTADDAAAEAVAANDAADDILAGLDVALPALGASIDKLESDSAAAIVMRAQAGSSGALLELVAGNNPTGSVSVARIAATNIILNGSVSAQQLSVGFNNNRVMNSNYFDGETSWWTSGSGSAHSDGTYRIRDAGESYTGEKYPTYQMSCLALGLDGYQILENRPVTPDNSTYGMAVQAGDWVEASVKVSVHRCQVKIQIRWRDAAGVIISTSALESITTTGIIAAYNDNPALWTQIGGKAQAPANAAYATFRITKYYNLSGTSSYVFFHEPMLCLTTEYATDLTSYAPDGTTMITGNSVVTDSLYASNINVASFSVAGLSIFGGTLQSTNFIANISGWQIKSNGDAQFNDLVVTGDMIVAGVVTHRDIYAKEYGATAIGTADTNLAKYSYLTLEPYLYTKRGSPFPDNPLTVTLSCELLNAISGGIYPDGWFSLRVEGRVNGGSAWVPLVQNFERDHNWPEGTARMAYTVIMTDRNLSSNGTIPTDCTSFRLVGKRSGNCVGLKIQNATVIFEQINK